MPLIRKMPKRGFNKRPTKGYHIVNFENLAKLKKQSSITPDLLKEKGIIKGPVNFVKILGDGEISIPITIKAHAFSKTAREKITNVGGKCELLSQEEKTKIMTNDKAQNSK